MINFLNGLEGGAGNIDYMETLLLEKGWKGKQEVFGGSVINYGRWPAEKEPAVSFGFGLYRLD